MAGEAGPGRRELAAARHRWPQGIAVPGETVARLRPWGARFGGEAAAKFYSRAWGFPRDESAWHRAVVVCLALVVVARMSL